MMDMWLSSDDQYRFIQTLKMDSKFRDQVHDALTGDPFLTQEEMVERVVGDIKYDVKNGIKDDILDDILDDISREIKEEVSDEWGEDVIEKATSEVVDRISISYDQMIKEIKEDVVVYLSRQILDEESNKFIKKRVEEKIIKMRTYRSDLLDLDDE